jgi:hypothetical protein
MKKLSSYAGSLARCAPLLLAVLGLTAAVVVGCGIADDDDPGISEDEVSCQYGYGYGCYGYGYRN